MRSQEYIRRVSISSGKAQRLLNSTPIPVNPSERFPRTLRVAADHCGLEICSSPAMNEVLRLARRAAVGDSKVLVTGESGVGKDLVARTLHAESARSRGPVRGGQLRRADRDAPRVRAVRPRQGQLHRRVSRQDRQAPGGGPRHALPRRSGGDEPPDAGASSSVPRIG